MRAATRNEQFSDLTCLNKTSFKFFSVFSLVEMIKSRTDHCADMQTAHFWFPSTAQKSHMLRLSDTLCWGEGRDRHFINSPLTPSPTPKSKQTLYYSGGICYCFISKSWVWLNQKYHLFPHMSKKKCYDSFIRL